MCNIAPTPDLSMQGSTEGDTHSQTGITMASLLQATTRKKDILGFSGIVYEGDKEVSVDCCCFFCCCTPDNRGSLRHETSRAEPI